jgi:hypothetical protein
LSRKDSFAVNYQLSRLKNSPADVRGLMWEGTGGLAWQPPKSQRGSREDPPPCVGGYELNFLLEAPTLLGVLYHAGKKMAVYRNHVPAWLGLRAASEVSVKHDRCKSHYKKYILMSKK